LKEKNQKNLILKKYEYTQSYYYINTTGISGDGTSSYNPYDCFTVQGVTSTPTGTEIYDWTSVESCNCSG
jgi:hypothetical protein